MGEDLTRSDGPDIFSSANLGPVRLRNRTIKAAMSENLARDAAQDLRGIMTKLNMNDGVPGGFWIDESCQVSQWIEQSGTV